MMIETIRKCVNVAQKKFGSEHIFNVFDMPNTDAFPEDYVEPPSRCYAAQCSVKLFGLFAMRPPIGIKACGKILKVYKLGRSLSRIDGKLTIVLG